MKTLQKTMEKSSWKNFLNNDCFEFIASVSTERHPLDEIVKTIQDKNICEAPFNQNRELVGGSSVLQFQTPSGETTRLDKQGIVYKYNNIYIIDSYGIAVIYKIA